MVDRNAEFPSAAVGKGSLIYMHLKFLFASILKFYDAVSVQTICLSWTTRVVNWSQETVMIASFFSFSLVIILIVLALL